MPTPFSVDVLRDLFRHMEWADAAVWRAVFAHPPAAGDDDVRRLLCHLHNVQRAFVHVWRGEALTLREPADFPDSADLAAWATSSYPLALGFLDSVDTHALEQPVLMPWLAEFERHMGRAFQAPTLSETMFQVTSHSTYHRGQVNLRLRAIGGEPPLVDYIAWIWFGRPSPEWGTDRPAAT